MTREELSRPRRDRPRGCGGDPGRRPKGLRLRHPRRRRRVLLLRTSPRIDPSRSCCCRQQRERNGNAPMTAQTEHRLKVALWLIPLIFSAGSFYGFLTIGSADVSERVEQVEAGLKIHSALKAHPVGAEKMETILVEQRELRRDMASANENLAAICAAIPGARCR